MRKTTWTAGPNQAPALPKPQALAALEDLGVGLARERLEPELTRLAWPVEPSVRVMSAASSAHWAMEAARSSCRA